jgi:hypothetical protein
MMTDLAYKLGLDQEHYGHYVNFARRNLEIAQIGYDHDCILLVDAEQTFIQHIIDSFAI